MISQDSKRVEKSFFKFGSNRARVEEDNIKKYSN
jgi:hypothetical protein